MKSFVFCVLLVACFSSCSKEQTEHYIATDPIILSCFKGKYVGDGCWPVVQVLNSSGFLVSAKWQSMQSGSQVYDSTVAVQSLAGKYRNGAPFYFTITKLDSNIVHVMNCNTPKYVIEIGAYSDSTCVATSTN